MDKTPATEIVASKIIYVSALPFISIFKFKRNDTTILPECHVVNTSLTKYCH